jgi:lipid II:glycine glycyltransferase (peptidoglycan interpeptide bridge formation enzyme)
VRYATYRVDTAGGERAVWSRLHAASTRRGIKKAERDGVAVERDSSVACWRTMADLQAATSHRHGLPAPPTRFFAETCRGLQAAGLADLYVARAPNGDVIGAVVLWKGARSWIYAFGASRQDALDLRPTHALLWRALRDAIAAGVGFDLGRAAPEQEGLVQFKERWGGAPVPLAYDYHPAPRGVHVAARDRGPVAWANRAWAALPPAVARRGDFLYRYLA